METELWQVSMRLGASSGLCERLAGEWLRSEARWASGATKPATACGTCQPRPCLLSCPRGASLTVAPTAGISLPIAGFSPLQVSLPPLPSGHCSLPLLQRALPRLPHFLLFSVLLLDENLAHHCCLTLFFLPLCPAPSMPTPNIWLGPYGHLKWFTPELSPGSTGSPSLFWDKG